MVNADQLLDIISPRLKDCPPKSLSNVDLEILNELLDKFSFNVSTKAALIGFLYLGWISTNFETTDNYINELLDLININGSEIIKVTKNFEFFLNYLGQELINKNLNELARKIFRAALNQAKLENNTDTIAIISRSHAYAYYKDNDIQKSARLYEIASSLFSDPNEIISCLVSAAILKYSAKDFLHAINILENALKVAQRLENNTTLILELTIKITDIQREVLLQEGLIDINTSFLYIQNIGQRLKALNQIKELASFYYETGIVLDRLEYKDSALQYFEEASRIAYEKEIWPLYGRICLQLGLIAQTKKDFQISKSYFEQVVQVAEYLDDPELKSKGSTLIQSIEKFIELTDNSTSDGQDVSKSIDISPNAINQSSQPVEFTVSPITTTNNTHSSQQKSKSIPTQKNIHSRVSDKEIKDSTLPQLSVDLLPVTKKSTLPDNSVTVQSTNAKSNQSFNEAQKTYETIRAEIMDFLAKDGYSIQSDVVPFHGTSSVDIIASKGNIRRKKMFIMICANPEEAGISAYLLHNLEEQGTKVIYLIEGNPLTVLTSPDVEIITGVQQLEQKL